MAISIFPPARRHIRRIESKFALQHSRDRWNDYSFQTQYHLYYHHPEEDAVFVGTLCILRLGQTPEDGIRHRHEHRQGNLPGISAHLSGSQAEFPQDIFDGRH